MKIKIGKPIENGLQGAAFGLTEAVIMMMGVLYALSVTADKFVVILGVLASGIADAFANSSAFHISEESEGIHSKKGVWKSTLFCFIGTIIPLILFISSLLFLPLFTAAVIDWIIGLAILAMVGYYVGIKCSSERSYFHIFEYLALGIIVPLVCYLVGKLVMGFAS